MNVAWVCLFPFYFIMVEGSWGKGAGQLLTLGCLCFPVQGECVSQYFQASARFLHPQASPYCPVALDQLTEMPLVQFEKCSP